MRNCVSDDAKGRKWKGKWQAARLLERRWKREEKERDGRWMGSGARL
jgi:hypothetical protein